MLKRFAEAKAKQVLLVMTLQVIEDDWPHKCLKNTFKHRPFHTQMNSQGFLYLFSSFLVFDDITYAIDFQRIFMAQVLFWSKIHAPSLIHLHRPSIPVYNNHWICLIMCSNWQYQHLSSSFFQSQVSLTRIKCWKLHCQTKSRNTSIAFYITIGYCLQGTCTQLQSNNQDWNLTNLTSWN